MQQTIQLGQVVQPSVLSRVEGIVKNWRERFDSKIEQSGFCQVLGIRPWHFTLQGLAVTAFTGLVIFMVCGFAGWLSQKGGAAL